MTPMIFFGTSLKALRRQKKLTQKELAEILNLGQTAVANYEKGLRFPDLDTLISIADYFETSLDVLLGRSSIIQSSKVSYPNYTIENLRLHVLNELKSYDFNSLKMSIDRAVRNGLPSRVLFDKVYTPVMYEIGKLWEQGYIGIHEEHVMSELMRHIISYTRALYTPLSKNGKTFLGLTASGEDHALGMMMLCDELFLQGWTSFFAGTSMPLFEAVKAVETFKPDVIGISITQHRYRNHGIETANEIIKKYDIPIVFGGKEVIAAEDFSPFLTAPPQVGESVDFIAKIIDLK